MGAATEKKPDTTQRLAEAVKAKAKAKADGREPGGARKPLLEITTLAPERPTVVIDEVEHEFRLLQEFGATEHQEFTREVARYDELWGADRLKRVDQEKMGRLVDRLVDRVLVDPARLREQLGDRLSGAIKREIVVTFTRAPLLMAMAQEADEETDEEQDSSTMES